MADNTLRKLKRAELLEMLIEQGKEAEKLRKQVEELTQKLSDRQILLDRAGTIAEASFQLNGVLEAAQEAAQQYLDNLDGVIRRQEEKCAQAEAECLAQCEAQRWETKIQCEEMERAAKEQCAKRIREAKAECEAMERAVRDECEKKKWETEAQCEEMLKRAKEQI